MAWSPWLAAGLGQMHLVGEEQRREEDGAVCRAGPLHPNIVGGVELLGSLREAFHWTHFSMVTLAGAPNVPVERGVVRGMEKNNVSSTTTGPLHYGNPGTDLQMSLFSDYLGLLFT